MGFRCGIVGLPNVGKSTLFNALTRSASAQAANYPFCTIEPNVGRVAVPDARLQTLSALVVPQATVPTTVEFVDIAGLVAGASQGEGLGNRFLAHIREVDAVIHVVRAFHDRNITHVTETISPASDIETIHTELLLADIEMAERALTKAQKASKSGNKEQVMLQRFLETAITHLNTGDPLRTLVLSEQDQAILKPFFFLTMKPTVYLANVSDNGFEHNPLLQEIIDLAEREQTGTVAICAAIEQEMSELTEQEAALFLNEMGFAEPGLNRLIRTGYTLLDLQTYFTAGKKEVRAWTVPVGATAPQAAGAIHSDFEKGFIRSETISYEDFVHYRGEQGAREAGRLRLEGKDYVVKDGDIMHFRFNV